MLVEFKKKQDIYKKGDTAIISRGFAPLLEKEGIVNILCDGDRFECLKAQEEHKKKPKEEKVKNSK